MLPNFLSATGHGEAFHGLGVQDVKSLILVDSLFPLDGGRRKEGNKEKKLWGGGFPWGIPALLAISWVTADRCN
jgi:hypothetical protein